MSEFKVGDIVYVDYNRPHEIGMLLSKDAEEVAENSCDIESIWREVNVRTAEGKYVQEPHPEEELIEMSPVEQLTYGRYFE